MATLGPDKVQQIQEALQQEKIDGWLFFNFRGSNVFATRIINLPAHIMQTRRYFYFIPASGTPQKLLHNIEQWNLDLIPGDKTLYVSWQSLREGVKKIVGGAKKIAMEYSPMNNIPYVSNVDAGTMELVRAVGLEVVSSANLVSRFESTWDDEQAGDNMMTAKHLRQIVDLTFGFIKQRINAGTPTTEYDVQQFMLSEFKTRGLMTESDPNCSVNANSANPHYEPTKEIHSPLHKGDFVLLDLWAKKDKTRSVYGDITWTGYIGETVPEEYTKVFEVVKGGRDAAIRFVRSHSRPARKFAATRLMMQPATISRRRGTISISCIARGIPSAKKSTGMVPTSTTWKHETNGRSFRRHHFPSSQESISPANSACEAKLTCTLRSRGKRSSQACPCRKKWWRSSRSNWLEAVQNVGRNAISTTMSFRNLRYFRFLEAAVRVDRIFWTLQRLRGCRMPTSEECYF